MFFFLESIIYLPNLFGAELLLWHLVYICNFMEFSGLFWDMLVIKIVKSFRHLDLKTTHPLHCDAIQGNDSVQFRWV